MATPTPNEPTLGSPLSLATTATAVVDAHGIVIGWNHAAQELLGFSPEEVIGKPVRTFFVPLDGGPLIDPDQRLECWGQTRLLRHRAGTHVRAVLYVPAPGPRRASQGWVIVAVPADEMERWNQDQAMLAGLFAQSPLALTVYDQDTRVRWFNDAVARMGVPRGSIGHLLRDVAPDMLEGEILTPEFQHLSVEEIIDQVYRTGEPVVDLHFRGVVPQDPAHHRVWSATYFRLQDPADRVLGVCESAYEITGRYEAQQRLALLGSCSTLGRTLDVTRTAQELVTLTVPDFADAARVELVETVLAGGDVPATPGPLPPLLVPVAESSPPSSAPPAQAPPVQWRSAEARDGSRQIVLPLRIGDAELGHVTFTRIAPRDPFSAVDVALAEEMVSYAAISLDNARRYVHQRATALVLQRQLLPRALAVPSAVEVAHHYAPTAGPPGVGGDWYDVIPLSGLRVGLVVGDVVGHGLHAAATMGRLRTTVRALAGLDLPPDELLSRLDDLVAQASIGLDPGADSPEDLAIGARCLYAVYDPVSRRCTVASAGHLPPLLVQEHGASLPIDVPVGLPLGVAGVAGLPYESVEFELPENALLVLFTDGLVAGRKQADAEAGVVELCRNLDRHQDLSPQETRDLIMAWHANDPAPDDAVLLVVRAHALETDQMASLSVSSDPAEVAAARAWAADRLTAWGLEELSFVVELMVSELVTNAIRYGRPPVLLRLLRDQDGALICEVSDGGHTSPHLRHAGPDDEGGRGLFLVAQLTGRWGTRYTRGGKTIWTEVPTNHG
ncbi:PAS domain S-box protein [Streptomyces antnestii]|uniref:PAS domain S-box protein n=1 Tax=Streptomyces antnestii TaxID=2494256 RepID=A0A3S2WNG9_9ACTN|nr:SpoIIE family protein phosphatase [Streptomyces sp. San01]RVU29020.1 PAS domain S-box protein [Streptomyces sp. San01]